VFAARPSLERRQLFAVKMAEEKAEAAPFQEKEEVEYRVSKPEENEDQEDHKAKIRVLIIVIAVIVLVGVAFVLGYVVRLVVHRCGGPESTPSDTTEMRIQEAAENISSSNIENQLRYLYWRNNSYTVAKIYHALTSFSVAYSLSNTELRLQSR